MSRNLKGRTARCHCGREVPSSTSLPFFEFRGDGSKRAIDTCTHCRYAEVAHTRKQETGEKHLDLVCDNFEPHGAYDNDSYYCGCRGWD